MAGKKGKGRHSLVPAAANLRVLPTSGWSCPPPAAGRHGGAHPGRLAWKGMSAKLWPSWAMIRSTSAYGRASRAKPRCWGL